MHIKERPAGFKRFNAVWTPTILILDSEGHEHYRIEGYLPRGEFHAQLLLGIARNFVMHKRWKDAEPWYERVINDFPNTKAAPEAIYWRGVSRYSVSHDGTALGATAAELDANHPDSIWTQRASVWRSAA